MSRQSVNSICVLFALFSGMAHAESPQPAKLLSEFAELDRSGAWVKNRGYMRSKQDSTWKVRMRTFQSLVREGNASVPPLLNALKHGDTETRILAAQTLGYLAPNVPRDALLDAATSDSEPAVRLYAIDSLGMQGGRNVSGELERLQQNEKNRDVKKHIGYALERGTQGLVANVVEDLLGWDAATMDSAKVGEPAPEFTLATVDGKQRIRLADFRDKQAVVLVFVYGDT